MEKIKNYIILGIVVLSLVVVAVSVKNIFGNNTTTNQFVETTDVNQSL